MKIKLWVDDIRLAPDNTWDCARSFHEAIVKLETNNYETVSLDHDLGSFYGNREMSGYDIMSWLVARKVDGTQHVPVNVFVHSANPVGVANIQSLIDKFF